DEGVAEIAIMQIEIERRSRRRLQHGNGRSPFVAVALSCWIGMEGREGRKVFRGDSAGADAIAEIAGKLRPPSRFQSEILARNDGAAIGQMSPALGQIVSQFLHRSGEDGQGQV